VGVDCPVGWLELRELPAVGAPLWVAEEDLKAVSLNAPMGFVTAPPMRG
jgi:hypothetical protein